MPNVRRDRCVMMLPRLATKLEGDASKLVRWDERAVAVAGPNESFKYAGAWLDAAQGGNERGRGF
jgi:hypothetical protein